MTQDKPKEANSKFLSFLNLSDSYERRARFFPAVLTVAVLTPLAIMVGAPLDKWIAYLATAGVLAAAISVGLSHWASAAGNRLQGKLFPNWPHDAPTNRWLLPDDETCSAQQKERWYGAIKRLTGLDIPSVANSPAELRRTINDALRTLRSDLWRNDHAA